MTKAYMNRTLSKKARKRKEELAEKGIHRSLIECGFDVWEKEQIHSVLQDINSTLKEVRKYLPEENNTSRSPSSQRRSGGWLY